MDLELFRLHLQYKQIKPLTNQQARQDNGLKSWHFALGRVILKVLTMGLLDILHDQVYQSFNKKAN